MSELTPGDFGITVEETEAEPFEEVSNPYDPFDGAGGTNTATLITLMRIYDTLLALVALQDDDKADALMTKHARGQLIASLPQLEL